MAVRSPNNEALVNHTVYSIVIYVIEEDNYRICPILEDAWFLWNL
jgi:hypothetical protein